MFVTGQEGTGTAKKVGTEDSWRHTWPVQLDSREPRDNADFSTKSSTSIAGRDRPATTAK